MPNGGCPVPAMYWHKAPGGNIVTYPEFPSTLDGEKVPGKDYPGHSGYCPDSDKLTCKFRGELRKAGYTFEHLFRKNWRSPGSPDVFCGYRIMKDGEEAGKMTWEDIYALEAEAFSLTGRSMCPRELFVHARNRTYQSGRHFFLEVDQFCYDAALMMYGIRKPILTE